jgi:hypothetical protein
MFSTVALAWASATLTILEMTDVIGSCFRIGALFVRQPCGKQGGCGGAAWRTTRVRGTRQQRQAASSSCLVSLRSYDISWLCAP